MASTGVIFIVLAPAFLVHALFFRIFFRQWDKHWAAMKAGQGTNGLVFTALIGMAVYIAVTAMASGWMTGIFSAAARTAAGG